MLSALPAYQRLIAFIYIRRLCWAGWQAGWVPYIVPIGNTNTFQSGTKH